MNHPPKPPQGGAKKQTKRKILWGSCNSLEEVGKFFVVVLSAIMGDLQTILFKVIKPIPPKEILLSNFQQRASPPERGADPERKEIKTAIRPKAVRLSNQKYIHCNSKNGNPTLPSRQQASCKGRNPTAYRKEKQGQDNSYEEKCEQA